MRLKEELITPVKAKELLENNIENRKVKEPVVLRYTKDILEGRWKQGTAEPIKIATSGRILDGQHRLMAVVKSNRAVFFLVAYDLDESIFDVIDTGSVRSGADVFRINSIKNDSHIVAIIAAYNTLKITMQSSRGVQKQNKLTNAQLLDQYNSSPEFWQFVHAKSRSWYNSFSKVLTASTLGAFFATFYDINKEQAIDFMNQLCTGEEIKNNSIKILRKRLIDEKISSKKTNTTTRNVLLVKSWNFYRLNKQVNSLKFNPDLEDYPRPI